MDGLNKVSLIGNLGRDPEMRYTANGSGVATFTLAVNRSYTGEHGKKEEVEWVPIVTWNKLAELCAEHLNKGRKVYVEGRLSTRSWDGPDGQKKYRTEVIASQVLFLDRAMTLDGSPDDLVEVDDLPFD